MSSIARDRIRRCLAMIPLIRARPGIRIPELASIFGVRDAEIWEDLTEVLTMCGVPPYLPHNYLVFSIHGDRVSIRFAEHLSRPVHLTLQEALAIDLALRSVSGGRLPAFGDAAPRLRRKLRDLLGGRDREALEALDENVRGTPPSDAVTETICLLKDAMGRNVRVQIVYYTASRDDVTERIIEPFGLIDHRGNWYVIARDLLHDRETSFRVDRIRTAQALADQEYEVPDDFTTEKFRRDDVYAAGPDDVAVRVRFSKAVAARIREEADRKSLQELADGGVVRTFRIAPSRPRWLYTYVARYGPQAEVLAPPEIRAGMARFLESVLGTGPAADRSSTDAAGQGRSSARTAAAVSRRESPRARKRPKGHGR
jgi:proteasome accessory factor C